MFTFPVTGPGSTATGRAVSFSSEVFIRKGPLFSVPLGPCWPASSPCTHLGHSVALEEYKFTFQLCLYLQEIRLDLSLLVLSFPICTGLLCILGQ